MAQTERPAVRGDRLAAEIAAARDRLDDRRNLEWAEVGDLIRLLSEELNEATHLYDDDPQAAHGRLDAVERRLAELRGRIDAAGTPGT